MVKKEITGQNRGYWIRVALISLMVLFGGSAVVAVCNDQVLTGWSRPDIGEGTRREYVRVTGSRETLVREIEIPEKQPDKAWATAQLKEACSRLDEIILGSNSSPKRVTGNLYLPESLMDGQVFVSFEGDDKGLYDYEGILTGTPADGGEETMVRALLTCRSETINYALRVVVYPPAPGELSWQDRVTRALELANEDTSGDTYVLPEQVDGETVVWHSHMDNPAPFLAGAVWLVGFLLPMRKKEADYKARKLRQEQLMLAYPAFTGSITLLLSAGISLRECFYYFCKDDRQNPVLMETVRQLILELEQGTDMSRALENLGRRTGLWEYKVLCSLLDQNRKKGNAFLLTQLQQEADKAFAAQQRRAKVWGNEAGTKLLLPMGGMLLVVLFFVLYPAMVSF